MAIVGQAGIGWAVLPVLGLPANETGGISWSWLVSGCHKTKWGGESWDWLGTTYGHAIDWMAGLGLLSIKQGGGRDG
ncbi:hypothetical protein PPACK8108_LOCUS4252 [Phakopsora pachyrhizi]|uniref:Uncharacterized protein n=1 Tax=Phakopsora pachyrhizi TaxID=170000 RepID=A0AAV0ALJ6_PHAPC|nr:hypothetical protein PPACK8108_LOCUS4252 [Phakopsora pachyrhizi]